MNIKKNLTNKINSYVSLAGSKKNEIKSPINKIFMNKIDFNSYKISPEISPFLKKYDNEEINIGRNIIPNYEIGTNINEGNLTKKMSPINYNKIKINNNYYNYNNTNLNNNPNFLNSNTDSEAFDDDSYNNKKNFNKNENVMNNRQFYSESNYNKNNINIYNKKLFSQMNNLSNGDNNSIKNMTNQDYYQGKRNISNFALNSDSLSSYNAMDEEKNKTQITTNKLRNKFSDISKVLSIKSMNISKENTTSDKDDDSILSVPLKQIKKNDAEHYRENLTIKVNTKNQQNNQNKSGNYLYNNYIKNSNDNTSLGAMSEMYRNKNIKNKTNSSINSESTNENLNKTNKSDALLPKKIKNCIYYLNNFQRRSPDKHIFNNLTYTQIYYPQKNKDLAESSPQYNQSTKPKIQEIPLDLSPNINYNLKFHQGEGDITDIYNEINNIKIKPQKKIETCVIKFDKKVLKASTSFDGIKIDKHKFKYKENKKDNLNEQVDNKKLNDNETEQNNYIYIKNKKAKDYNNNIDDNKYSNPMKKYYLNSHENYSQKIEEPQIFNSRSPIYKKINHNSPKQGQTSPFLLKPKILISNEEQINKNIDAKSIKKDDADIYNKKSYPNKLEQKKSNSKLFSKKIVVKINERKNETNNREQKSKEISQIFEKIKIQKNDIRVSNKSFNSKKKISSSIPILHHSFFKKYYKYFRKPTNPLMYISKTILKTMIKPIISNSYITKSKYDIIFKLPILPFEYYTKENIKTIVKEQKNDLKNIWKQLKNIKKENENKDNLAKSQIRGSRKRIILVHRNKKKIFNKLPITQSAGIFNRDDSSQELDNVNYSNATDEKQKKDIFYNSSSNFMKPSMLKNQCINKNISLLNNSIDIEIDNVKLNKTIKIKTKIKKIKKKFDFLNSNTIKHNKTLPKIKKSEKDINKQNKVNIIIREDLENYLIFMDNNEKYNWSIIEQIFIKIKMDLVDVIKGYLLACDELIENKSDISKANEYIKNIIIHYKNHYLNKNNYDSIYNKIMELIYEIKESNNLEENKFEIVGKVFNILLSNNLLNTDDLQAFESNDYGIKRKMKNILKFCNQNSQ